MLIVFYLPDNGIYLIVRVEDGAELGPAGRPVGSWPIFGLVAPLISWENGICYKLSKDA
jgi:hypothetical protein